MSANYDPVVVETEKTAMYIHGDERDPDLGFFKFLNLVIQMKMQ